jgi:hypothetical protein
VEIADFKKYYRRNKAIFKVIKHQYGSTFSDALLDFMGQPHGRVGCLIRVGPEIIIRRDGKSI